MNKSTKTVITLALSLAMTGCVSPQSEAPVIKAETAVMVKDSPMLTEARIMENLRENVLRQTRNKVKKQALAGVGVPYVFSGMSRSGWDCSGFTAYVFDRFGVKLEHSATKQAFQGMRVSTPEVGDLVAFSHGDKENFYHVAIYIGNGEIVHANSYRKTTLKEKLSVFDGDYIVYIRLIQ